MKQFSYVLTHANGLHVRLNSGLAREASRFKSAISIYKGERAALLSDVKAVSGLCVRCGDMIRITVEGIDEEAAVAAIQQYFVLNL